MVPSSRNWSCDAGLLLSGRAPALQGKGPEPLPSRQSPSVYLGSEAERTCCRLPLLQGALAPEHRQAGLLPATHNLCVFTCLPINIHLGAGF